MIYINSVTIKRGQSTETYTHINCRKCAIVKTKKKKIKEREDMAEKIFSTIFKGSRGGHTKAVCVQAKFAQ